MKKIFLFCGISGVVIFILTTWIGGLITPNYDQFVNAISELTETGAQYGPILAIPYCVYAVCLILFFIGIILISDQKIIKAASILQIINFCIAISAYTVMKMDPPGAVPTIGGMLHKTIGMSIGALLPLTSMLLFGIGLRKKMKKISIYTLISLLSVLIFGIITSIAILNKYIYIGLFQRIAMIIAEQWFVVLSITLLRSSALKESNRLI